MTAFHTWVFPAMWLSWAACWALLSLRVKATARREPIGRRLSHLVPLLAAAVLLGLPRLPVPVLGDRVFPWAPWSFWLGAAVTGAGLLFAVWARLHIGTNWSGIVTIKQGHELVMPGPYALVRHPIYTGLSLGFTGHAIARGEWRGVLAVVMVVGSFWLKLRFEESWMRQQFGAAYDDYSRRVPALIPFLLARRSGNPP
jgi:protein-S-isoprenylcysteine O-methyltransferase Ste14